MDRVRIYIGLDIIMFNFGKRMLMKCIKFFTKNVKFQSWLLAPMGTVTNITALYVRNPT
jgi:hypothetical protein